MANKQYVKELRKGVKHWNRWWKALRDKHKHPDEQADFQADFSEADLSNLDLNNVDFFKADLSKADLSGTSLVDADLNGAILTNTIFSKKTVVDKKWRLVRDIVSDWEISRNLIGVDLSHADLSHAFLVEANLYKANLKNTDLYKAIFQRANLAQADLSQSSIIETDFSDSELTEAKFVEAHIYSTHFYCANLNRADFNKADIQFGEFDEAILIEANFSESNLFRVAAHNTDFSRATLTGSCLEDWSINQETKLDGVVCEYVYKKGGQKERRPRSGKFAAGEFTALFQKAIETVDLIFIDGIDWQAFLQSFQELRKRYGEKISIQAIEKKSGDAFIVRLEVSPDINKLALEEEHKELYAKLLLMQERINIQDEQLTFYRAQIAYERQKKSEFSPIIQVLAENQKESLEVIKTMVQKESSRIINTGGGNYIESNSGTYVEGDFTNMSQDLAQAASQIHDLIEQLQKQGVTVDVAQEKVATEIANIAKKDPTMKNKLLKWGQSLGSATVSDVVKGAVKLAIRSAGIPLP